MEGNKQDLEKLQEYENLKIQQREIDERLKELQPDIIDLVPADKELVTSRGKFYIQKRAVYTYSGATESLRERLKAAEDEEKANGTYESVTYTKSLYYKSL